MPVRVQGAQADFQLVVKNSTGDFVDPTNLSLTFKDSLGSTVAGFPETYPGDIVKDGIGQYHLDWPIPSLFSVGSYVAQWDAILLGAPEVALETWEIVPAGSLSTGPLDFLYAPDDYDAIRGVLGVTTLDVEDVNIEYISFAPQAELLIKRRVSNWATQMTDPGQLYVLRLATVYQTACLMAESFVRGGTIGLVRPLGIGEGRDWAEAAQAFCAKAEYWITIADADDDGNVESDYTIRPMRVGGPTSLRISRRRAGVSIDGQPSDAVWAGYPPFWSE